MWKWLSIYKKDDIEEDFTEDLKYIDDIVLIM